jgi:hypothetical protein
MSLIKRGDKGQALTYDELDGNFTHLGGDGSYQFPATDGAPNQVLVTNGEGQLVFQDQLDVNFVDTDIQGSVYGHDSSLLVDAANNKFTGDLTGNVLGNTTGTHQGNVLGDDSTVLVEAYSGTINLNTTSIDSLQDVDVTSTPPLDGQVLKWNGTVWAPAQDVSNSLEGLDAETLGGFSASYYLNYDNFANTPTLSTVAGSNDYNDLDNLPTIPTVPTNVSDFTNDAGYISSVSVNLGYKLQVFTASGTWTVPDNVTSCRVFVIGGGGAGRLGYQGTNGSQGGWVVAYVSGLTPGSTVSIGVGAGGAFQGGQGGTSNFGAYATGTGGQGVNGNPPNNRTGSGSVGAGATLLTRGNNNEATNSFSSNGFPHWLQGNWRGTVRNASSGGGTNTSQLNWSLGSTVYPGSGGASQNNSNGVGTYAGVEGTVIIEY